MSISLYSAASGMEGQQTNLNVIADNIANVGTTGFKKSKVEFQDIFYQQVQSAGADTGAEVTPTGLQVGTGTRVASTSKVYTPGQLTNTDERMDIAIQGDGFLQVQDPNGDLLYTRDGALKTGPDGTVMTSKGMQVVGFPQVPQGTTDIVISQSGLVNFIQNGEPQGEGQIQLARFRNPSGLQAVGGNLLRETEGSGAPELGDPGADGFGQVQQGYLETSNVNIVQEMVNMIMAQRAYEINSKSIQASDEMLQVVNQLMR